jgi:hypothetical protein
MLTGAKRNWSQATRARIVPLTDDVLTYFVRTPYQVVAAGPKMTARGVSWWWWLERQRDYVRPPYPAMRPVRARSWPWTPRFSTSCCAIVSPVPKRMAVVSAWVTSGALLSFAWYLMGCQSWLRGRDRK